MDIQSERTEKKKLYHKPRLVTYGNLNEITQATKVFMGNADGGTMLRQKTG